MNDLIPLISFPITILFLGSLGSLTTSKEIQTWYDNLKKPWFNPPNYIYGPVWTTLYLMIGLSAYFIWIEQEDFFGKNRFAWLIFFIQMLLNLLWMPLFFKMQLIRIAHIEMCFLWIFILMNIICFYNISNIAGILLIPYLCWITFANILNYWTLILNPQDTPKQE